MELLFRLVVVKFEYIGTKCLFPIILNWDKIIKANFEIEIMNKIITQLESALGITNVRVVQNRVGTLSDLNDEFNTIIGDINFNSQNSQIKALQIDVKVFRPLTQEEIQQFTVEKFTLYRMNFPVKIFDFNQILSGENELPMLVIEN